MAQFYVTPAQVSAMNPITRQRILAQLPDIQRRTRRAKRLRGDSDKLKEMRDADYELGGYAGPATRGLTGTSRAAFDPVQRYIPNYTGAAKQLIGAVGGIFADREADESEDELNEARNKEIMDTVGQMGIKDLPEGSATENELRAYLGLMDADYKELGIEKGKHLTRQQIREGDGHVINYYSDGTWEDTGVAKEAGTQLIEPEGANRGIVNKRTGATTDIFPAGQAPGMQPPEAPPQIDVPGSGNAPSMGIEGMPPEAQQEIQTTVSSMTALGMPQDVIDDYVGRAVAKHEQQQSQAQPGMAPPPGVTPPPPTVTQQEGIAPPAPAPGMAPPAPAQSPYYVPSAGEKAAAQERSKLAEQNAAAEQTARTKGLERVGEKSGEQIVAAREMYAKAKKAYNEVKRVADKVLTSPHLGKLVGGSAPGRISSAGALGEVVNNVLMGGIRLEGNEGADLNALLNNLQDKAFMSAYTTALEGSGQVATVEAIRSAQAVMNGARSQSEPAYRAAVAQFLQTFADSMEMFEGLASQKLPGEPGYSASPAPAAPPELPPGFIWR